MLVDNISEMHMSVALLLVLVREVNGTQCQVAIGGVGHMEAASGVGSCVL